MLFCSGRFNVHVHLLDSTKKVLATHGVPLFVFKMLFPLVSQDPEEFKSLKDVRKTIDLMNLFSAMSKDMVANLPWKRMISVVKTVTLKTTHGFLTEFMH
jgi:hypothetical protein